MLADRRLPFALLCLLGAALLLVGCGGGEEITFPSVDVKVPDPGVVGSVSGTVFYDGVPSAPRQLRPPDAHCARSGHVILDEGLLAEDGRLANVLVWVKSGLEGYRFPLVQEEALVDQELCVFKPHVIAVRTWQPIRYRNSDPIVHNVNSTSSRKGQGFTFGISLKDGSEVRQFRQPELGIAVACDLHANMRMYVHVIDHPIFAVTGPDGRFELKGLPPGRYVLGAWHEKLGEKTMEVEIGEREVKAELSFRFGP